MAKPLRILFYFFCRKETGLGHWFRSLTLAQTAKDLGHQVFVASDRKPVNGLAHLPAKYLDPADLYAAIKAVDPDWLIVDLPDTPPAWIREMTACKIVTLNGIGYNQLDGADLRIVQGVADLDLPGQQDKVPTLKGIEYVIIRPELAKYRKEGGKDRRFTFVWGGGTDRLGLLTRFGMVRAGEPATLMMVDMTPPPVVLTPFQFPIKLNGNDDSMLEWLAGSRRAVVAMGMITWEAAALNVPCWVFSYSDLHLRFAQGMAKYGLIKAWPVVGLPIYDMEMRFFLEEPFEVNRDSGLGLDGALNVMKAIEERS